MAIGPADRALPAGIAIHSHLCYNIISSLPLIIKQTRKEGYLMKKVLILCQPDEPLKNCFDSIRAAEIVFSADAEIPQDTDCVLISQRFTGAALPELLLSCRRSSLPAAVFTDDASEQNQELLLDMGFDHILLLPMSAKLLDKQITALLGSASASEIGFALFAQLEQSDAKTGFRSAAMISR